LISKTGPQRLEVISKELGNKKMERKKINLWEELSVNMGRKLAQERKPNESDRRGISEECSLPGYKQVKMDCMAKC
jgi:hypothetical protein